MIPILTYHAGLIEGSDYDQNDHVAFAEDLNVIARLNLRIVPLQWLADALLQQRSWQSLQNCIAISCDDGTVFDAVADRSFGEFGPQPSLLSILQKWVGQDPAARCDAHITSFVIASEQARAVMDRECLFNRNDIHHHWWRDAQSTGKMNFGNHSWDHNHPVLPPAPINDMPRGDFFVVNNEEKADYEIAQAQTFLSQELGQTPSLFAYPFGHVPEFLRNDYLPRKSQLLGLQAAFSTEPGSIYQHSDRWCLPRYVCRWHWKTPGELERLLLQHLR